MSTPTFKDMIDTNVAQQEDLQRHLADLRRKAQRTSAGADSVDPATAQKVAAPVEAKQDATDSEEQKVLDEAKLSVLEMQQIHMLILAQRQDALTLRAQSAMIEEAEVAYERNRRIETLLADKGGIDLANYFLTGTVTQEIELSVSPRLSFRFRSVPARGALLAKEVANVVHAQLMGKTARKEEEPSGGYSVMWMTHTLEALLAVIEFNGEPGPGANINWKASADVLRKSIDNVADEWLQRDQPLLDLIQNQYLLFVARVRKALNHAGYVNLAKKNS